MRGRTIPTLRWLLFSGALILLTGCGKTGTVSGKVTLDGKPMPGGLVMFHHDGTTGDDETPPPAPARITEDGSFVAAHVPIGKTKVTVMTAGHLGSVMHPEDGKEPWGHFVPIPLRYGNPDKSGFALEVKLGKQEMNLDLKSEQLEGDAKPPAPPEEKK
jgi:hypothetical protein